MRFKHGALVIVTNCHSGGMFEDGDIVSIEQIGCEDDPNCYGAISPWDNQMWFLYDDEIEPATNADWVRQLDDESLAKFLDDFKNDKKYENINVEKWIKEMKE